jgi:sugar lactone lactonase YvrE
MDMSIFILKKKHNAKKCPRNVRKTSLLIIIFIPLIFCCTKENKYPVVTTLAGSGTMGSIDGKKTEATFSYMMGLAVDEKGNVYVADSHNNLIRKIDANGMVSTLAGNGMPGFADGKGIRASFFNPEGVAVDKWGNVYVSDTHNNLIRKINPDGLVTTIAGRSPDEKKTNTYAYVKFDNPAGIAVDTIGNIYIADWGNDLIRKISVDGKVTDLAGNGNPGAIDGVGSSSSFYLPGGIAVDDNGNVYVSDTYNNKIRKISSNGTVTTIAGKKIKGSNDGRDTSASFSHPAGIAVDKAGNIYVADVRNNKIRKINPDGVVTTFAGTGLRGALNGPAINASFYNPYGVAVDKNGIVYVADYQNNLIRKISY